MRISSVPDVKALKPTDKDELLAEIARELIQQREENDRLKLLAEKANVGMTLWKAVTTVSAVVVALGVGLLWAGGEWSAWTQIKAVHKNDNARSGAVIYDHLDMDDQTMAALRDRLGLPDFDGFARKTDLWTDQQLVEKLTEAGFVKYGDRLGVYVFVNASEKFVPMPLDTCITVTSPDCIYDTAIKYRNDLNPDSATFSFKKQKVNY